VDFDGPSEDPGIEAFRRRARTEDGWELLTLRATRLADRWVVECEVWPRPGDPSELIRRGPYTFPTERAARAFADEATLALEYLGCRVS
jgi:hypothetical protein